MRFALFALLLTPGQASSLGIVVHGYHLSASRFEEVVWGSPATQRLGRLPHACRLAWEGRDDLAAFICGTGASRDSSGQVEADALAELLFARLPTLCEFDCFAEVDLAQLEALLRRVVVADASSLNTQQECAAALSRLHRDGVRRAVLVSSPTHAPRCLRDACAAAELVGFEGRIDASPCATSCATRALCTTFFFTSRDPANGFDGRAPLRWTEHPPVVIESPHRPDRQSHRPAGRAAGLEIADGEEDGEDAQVAPVAPPTPPFYELARRAADLAHSAPAARRDAFLRGLDALLAEHQC